MASFLISSAVDLKFCASLKFDIYYIFMQDAISCLLDQTHEDTGHLPPSSGTIGYEGLALVKTQVSPKLKRKLILLIIRMTPWHGDLFM